ncbi:molybdenum cofactor biosynthesis protein MoaE [soil metagenome]
MLRESAGTDSLELELDDAATVGDAIAALGREPALGESARMPVRLAVNREYAPDAQVLDPGDELAAIPPVSGGAPDDAAGGRVKLARVTAERLDPSYAARSVGDPGAGAIVTFQGTTREVDRLTYEAYAEMAEPKMQAILAECIERHDLRAAAAEHRIGDVELGEPSVVVAVSAAHREEAFAGAREAIDRIKAEAPIWKREVESDGAATWVEGTLP